MIDFIQKNTNSSFIYPFCREKGCYGVLKININEDFSINYQCDKNKNHKKKTIYFKTFERFYLKEKKVEKCSKCNANLETDIKYKCSQCKSKYCGSCFLIDKHISKNIHNLIIINTNVDKCKFHKKDLTHYCIKCKKKLCIYCIKKEKENNNHNYICLIDLIPSSNKIKDLKNKIRKRASNYENIINLINIWKKNVVNKIEELKQNLRDEIDFMEKMFSNYNKYFVNYTYFKNFEYFYDYISQKSRDIFNGCDNLQKLTSVLFKIFNFNNNKKNKSLHQVDIDVNEDENKLLYKNKNDYKTIEKINDEYLFNYSSENKRVSLTYINNENNSIIDDLEQTKIKYNNELHSISLSRNKNKIIACLSNQRIVRFFNIDLEQKIMEESNEEINDDIGNNKQFNKCIEISNGFVAVADNELINIFGKNDNDINYYSYINTIILNSAPYDLLLISNEYFASSQPLEKTISFCSINSLSLEKTLPNIDCVKTNNCLFLFKDYMLVNCKKGIALITIKYRELVQYIENFFMNMANKLLCTDNYNNIFILDIRLENQKIYEIIQLKYVEGSFEKFRNYSNIIIDGEEENNEHIEKMIYMDKLILCSNRNKVYFLEMIDDL